MKILVLGATGGVGSHVVTYALEHGHEVTVLARTPAKVTATGVKVVQGDALDPAVVRTAVVGQDVVVSALASTEGPGKDTSLRRMAQVLARAMAEEGVRRVVWCASEGVDGEIPGVVGWAVQKMLAKPLADHHAAVAALREAGLVVTVARPRALNDDPLDTAYTEVVDGPADGGWSIPRASVAHFMVKALDDARYEGASVALAVPKKKKKKKR